MAEIPLNPDDYNLMVRRRLINDSVTEPVDMYWEGMNACRYKLALGAADTVVDIGCSSGEFLSNAALKTVCPARLVGIDHVAAGYTDYTGGNGPLPRFTFIQANAEAIPLADDSVAAVSAHNMLFRSPQPLRVLDEMSRITQENGLLLISTNSQRHGLWRHGLERAAARIVSEELGMYVEPPALPAANFLLDDVTGIIRSHGGLKVIDIILQECEVIITEDNVNEYLQSIKETVNRTTLDRSQYGSWFTAVDERIGPYVRTMIDQAGWRSGTFDPRRGPHFADTVDRALFVIKKTKP